MLTDKDYFLTKGTISIGALPVDKWGITINDDSIRERNIFGDFVTWKSEYLNRQKVYRTIKQSLNTKIIVFYDAIVAGGTIHSKIVEMDYVENWVSNKIKAIEQCTLFDDKKDMLELPSFKELVEIKEKISSELTLTRTEINLVIRILRFLKGKDILKKNFTDEEIEKLNPDLIEYFNIYEQFEQYRLNDMILPCMNRTILVQKEVSNEVKSFLMNKGYQVIEVGDTQTYYDIIRLRNQGLVIIDKKIAKVHDSVGINIVSYLKENMKLDVKIFFDE